MALYFESGCLLTILTAGKLLEFWFGLKFNSFDYQSFTSKINFQMATLSYFNMFGTIGKWKFNSLFLWDSIIDHPWIGYNLQSLKVDCGVYLNISTLKRFLSTWVLVKFLILQKQSLHCCFCYCYFFHQAE